ncbi:MAG TPA: hypothetical protein VF704_13405 [Allosphingosinicella sp.]|jgi:hypothetical protein
MPNILPAATRIAAIAGAALLVAGCGGDGDEAANQAQANAPDANLMLGAPANDASAMESVANAPEPMETGGNDSQANGTADVLGNTSGGDTGGNTVDSNVGGL